jgi:chitinase
MKLATAARTKVTVSAGGWSGGVSFSTMASSASSRANFIQWNVNFITKYGTAGVDIDWEYPGSIGAGCNTRSSNDVNNLLSLVGELRSALDNAFPNNHKEITLAVHVTPWGPGIFYNDLNFERVTYFYFISFLLIKNRYSIYRCLGFCSVC